jgi:hypothetical protein
MSVGKGRDGRQLQMSDKNINSNINMKTNTHNQNHLTTTPSAAQGAKPLCERILLGIDQHAADLRIVRQLDGAGTQPPQRIYPGSIWNSSSENNSP